MNQRYNSDFSLIASECGLSNAEDVGGVYFGNDLFSIGFEKASGQTSPAYYNLGSAIRIYAGNQVVLSSKYTNLFITNVQFELNDNYKWTTAPQVSSGVYNVNSQSWEGNTTDLTFTTSDKVYISKITITVLAVIEEDDNPEISVDENDWNYIGQGEFKDAWFNNLWSAGVSAPFEVPVYQSKSKSTQYMVKNPYGEGTPYVQINESSETGHIIFDITNPECVLVRPYVYAMTMTNERYCCSNVEGRFYYVENLSYSDIKERMARDGYTLSTYDITSGTIAINSALFSISNEENPANFYTWNDFCMDGWLVLPNSNGGSKEESHSVAVEYMANGSRNSVVMKQNANKEFEIEIPNAEWFYFLIDDENTFFVNLYGSSLGKELPLVTSTETGESYTFTPWKGNYKLVVSADLSKANITTTTPKPSTIDVYLTGDYANWTYTDANKFTQIREGEYSYTVPNDINTTNGGWKIASPESRYVYSYSGAVNPSESYQFEAHAAYATSISLNKGDVVNLKFDIDRYTAPATVNIVRVQVTEPEPPVGEQTKTIDINGVEYTLYITNGYMMATDGSKAKGDVSLVASTEGLTLKGIANGAFKGNGEIWAITVPEGAQTIGDEAFSGCMNLQDVVLPTTLTAIGRYAFLDCSYINSFSLPAAVNDLGLGAFQNCTDLEIFKFNQAKLSEISDALFEGCKRLQEVEIPATVNKIGANAFQGSGVVKIGTTTNVEIVGNRAFENSNLAQFDFNNVNTIGVSAFSGTMLKRAEFTSKLSSIGEQAFYNCKKLAKVELSEKIKNIGKSTFEGCDALTSIEIPASVTEIMENAFYNSGLVTVTIGDGVTSLGTGAFVTETLTSISLGSGITKLDNSPISTQGMLRLNTATPPILGSDRLGCTPTVVIVPKGTGATYLANSRWKNYNIVEESDEIIIYLSAPGALTSDLRMKQKLAAQVTSLVIVTSPEKGSLNDTDWKSIKSNMTSLIKLDISDSDVENIPDECFKNKKILTEIVLPKNLKTIGKSAFEGCTLLGAINLPSTLTAIGERAFADCNSMVGDLVVPAGCSVLGKESFKNCFALDNVIIKATSLNKIEECAFENCRNLDTVTLPQGILAIGEGAFAETGILSINFPQGLTSVGANAFEGCFYLTNVELPSSLTTLGERAFAKTGLIGITLPAGISEIEDETFLGCDDLRYVNLPSGLKSLGNSAIASPSVSAISSPAQVPPTAGVDPFLGINNYTCTLSIPAFSFNDYISAQYWGSFVGVHDNIDISIQGNPDITYTDEDDYQALLRNLTSNNVKGKKVRTASATRSIDPSLFGQLFNGAQMYVPREVKTRFFFNGDLSGYTVEYNGQDVTGQIDKNTKSWLAPAMNGMARMKIINKNSSVESVSIDSNATGRDVYNVAGIMIIKDATDEQIKNLDPGFYIMCGKKFLVK